MIKRNIDITKIKELLKDYSIVALLGPRQSGKTTLARQFPCVDYFDLENPRDEARLSNPQLAFENCSGLIIIDEIQRNPGLFPLLRHLVDTRKDQTYLILGSASPDLVRNSAETLAGRIAFYTLVGFRKEDVGHSTLNKLWLRGGLPHSFLAKSDAQSMQWREFYFQTFIERDIPVLGIKIPPATLRRFWQMISHYHGNIVNFSDIGRSFGIADTTVRHYIEILQGTFMVRTLQPWSVNIGKRLVKRPKIYIRDSGLYHSLLSIETEKALQCHPKLGASWEGFALDAVCRSISKQDNAFCFWATHAGAEVDLFWQHDGKNWACEFKFSDAPQMTKSMKSAIENLNLERLWIIYPGDKKYVLHKRIMVLPFRQVPTYWRYGV
ncbi:MAG: ATP-binding protein [Elusimicrobiota bacterium]